jgi:hypothetical protein
MTTQRAARPEQGLPAAVLAAAAVACVSGAAVPASDGLGERGRGRIAGASRRPAADLAEDWLAVMRRRP